MLVPVSTGAYGSKWGIWPYRLIGSSQLKIIILMDIWGLKHNFFSLTVCTLDQYLKNGSEKLVLVPYTGYAGCAITAGIPVKFSTAHGRCRPDVGSTKCIDVYGSGGVTPTPRIFGTSGQNIITLTDLLGSMHNFFSLTVCNLDQYLRNGGENSVFLS